eukprot:CAMPEP_0197031732 /NCGR_PEP_ID=MMETSP1384-20130603/10642_1 /TAXON_ID=29189 /ORGANISM="Ammonia sp." /LENGTH=645 /DNA_ID=CAMNT_0042461301 /DNA_START=448 /DNA_END=2385 /DNA_ORIENTATION=+
MPATNSLPGTESLQTQVTDSETTLFATANITCSASMACQNSYIHAGGHVLCHGITSCHATHIYAAETIECGGEQSCDHGELESLKSIACSTRKSCFASGLKSTHIQAYGEQSAANANVTGHIIEGYGSYSLSSSVIDSASLENMEVKLYGHYAGKAAVIVCRAGAHCEIDCKHTGCKRATLVCEDGSVCNLRPVGCNETNKVDGIDCPRLKTQLLDLDTDGDTSIDYGTDEAVATMADSAAIKVQNHVGLKEHFFFSEHQHSNQSVLHGITLCPTYHSCLNTYIDTNYTYCYGYESCKGALIEGDHISASNVHCYGADACDEAMIFGIRAVECNAKWSCVTVVEIATQTVYGTVQCNGLEACKDVAKALSSIYIECNGETSCSLSTLNAFMEVQCAAKHACFQSHVVSTNEQVTCSGQESCSESQVKATDMICSGESGCHHSHLVAESIRAYGAYSAAQSDIFASKILAYGYNALYFATIDSMGQSDLNIKMFGYAAGYGATVICRSGAKCKLTCKSNGCYETTFLCMKGSSCSVSPKGCTTDSIGSSYQFKVGDVDCPIWKTALLMEHEAATMDAVAIKEAVIQNELRFVDIQQNGVAASESRTNTWIYVTLSVIVFAVLLVAGFSGYGVCQRKHSRAEYDALV